MLEGQHESTAVIDAADVGRRPGEFVRFTLEEARLEKMSDGLSLHNAGLTEALALARVVGQPLPEIVVFGVQPEKIGWGEGLSHAVAGVPPALVEAVCDEVARLSRS